MPMIHRIRPIRNGFSRGSSSALILSGLRPMEFPASNIIVIRKISGPVVALLILIILIIKPGAMEKKLPALEEIQQRGYLNVLTLNSATTYYQDIEGPNGFEYQLAKLFSEHIGVFDEISH